MPDREVGMPKRDRDHFILENGEQKKKYTGNTPRLLEAVRNTFAQLQAL